MLYSARGRRASGHIHHRIPLLFVLFLVVSPLSLSAQEIIDNLEVLKISAADKAAVIRMPASGLRLIKPGDTLSKGCTVKFIYPEKIIMENISGDVPERIIIRITDKGQTIERVRPVPHTGNNNIQRSVPMDGGP